MPGIDIEPLLKLDLGGTTGQVRMVPFAPAPGRRGILIVHGADAEIDPSPEMFFLPRSTLFITAYDDAGRRLWRYDCGRGVVPGVWFCPVLPFDLDGDGADEVWLVGNDATDHPLSHRHATLVRLDPISGQARTMMAWPFNPGDRLPMFAAWRRWLLAGHAHGSPRLLLGAGTYFRMDMEAYGPALDRCWAWSFDRDRGDRGPRGCHMTPVLDLDGDGVDEVLFGERRLRLSDGMLLAEDATWNGHSDVVLPLRVGDDWHIWTCRETPQPDAARVCCYDAAFAPRWSDLAEGHMDQGWAVRDALGPGEGLVHALRIGEKTRGPGGTTRMDTEDFTWEAVTGRRHVLPFTGAATCIGADLCGSGRQALVRGLAGGDGAIFDAGGDGTPLASIPGTTCVAADFLDRPGEQVATWASDGVVTLHGAARPDDRGQARIASGAYRCGRRLLAVGYHQHLLGGC